MSESSVLAEVRNQVGHLTLNRPADLNAVDLEMVRKLQQQLEAWQEDDAVRVVVLRATGERAFCAGGDIRGMHESFNAGDGEYLVFFEEEYALDLLIHTYPKPFLALMDGFVLGGGMGLAQGASHRVLSEHARMGMPETAIGYFPDVGGSYFLPRLGEALGNYLGITGAHIRAADALYTGLADYCVKRDDFAQLDRALDSQAWSDQAEHELNRILQTHAVTDLSAGEIQNLRAAIDKHFAHETVREIRNSLANENNPDYQDWVDRTLASIDAKSPLAMEVTQELLRHGAELSLPDCFRLELHLDRQWFEEGDIMEGVRALIIDKDKTPKWNPPRLEDVSRARVERFFEGFSPVDS